MPQCKARQAKYPEKKHFGDNYHYFYVERRCGGEAADGQEVCRKCTGRTQECKVQERLQFDHGLIDEPIPEWSQIYGGPWYLKMVKIYGDPTAEVLKWAELYKQVAQLDGAEHKAGLLKLDMDPFRKKRERGGSPSAKAKADEPKAAGGAGRTERAESPKPRKGRRKATEEAEPKPKAKPRAKKKEPTQAAPPPPADVKPPQNLVATLLEKEIETLQVDNVEIIRVAIYEYDGTKYYCDEKKGKLYNASKAGKVGEYVGRWNPRTSTIETDIPDSDAEI